MVGTADGSKESTFTGSIGTQTRPANGIQTGTRNETYTQPVNGTQI